jgi:hypothetical protein
VEQLKWQTWNSAIEKEPMQRLKKYKALVFSCIIMVAAGLLVTQTPVRKNPSPADPGMNIVKVVNSSTGAVLDNDPTGGVEPDDPRDEELQDDIPTPESPVSLNVSKYEFVRLGPESAVGKAGDWALVVKGAGFYEAERAPLVHLGDSIVLQEVYVDPEGDELYALLPDSVAHIIQSADIRRLSVQNPGGLNRDRGRWIGLDITHEDLVKACTSAQKAALIHGDYFLQLHRY